MNFYRKNKNIILSAFLFMAALWAYSTFFKSSDVGVTTDAAAQKVGGDVLDLYASLQSVTLDQTLFSTALYRNLSDFSTDIPLQPTGRANPFDVIGK